MDDNNISAKVKHISRLDSWENTCKFTKWFSTAKSWNFGYLASDSYPPVSWSRTTTCIHVKSPQKSLWLFLNPIIILWQCGYNLFILWQCDYNLCSTKNVILCQCTTWHMIKKQHLLQNDHPVIQFSIFCKWDMDIVDMDLSKLFHQL